MKWIYGRQDWKTLERGLENCYLLTNGLGGFSSLTMTGAVARNDHSVFMVCTKAPNHRVNMVHRIKEELGIGESKYVLSTQEFADGTKEEGYRYLTEFSFEILPSWRYLINGIEIEKEIVMAQGSNQIAVNYHLKNRGQKEAALCVTPFFQFEPKGEDLKEDKIFSRQEQKITDGKYALFFETNGEVEGFTEKKETYFYSYDECDGRRENGTAGAVYQIKKRVNPGEETDLTVIYSMESLKGIDAKKIFDKIKEEQIHYQEKLIKTSGLKNKLAQTLVCSADKFLSKRESTDGLTILAGFPFFEDWGRDTMIALPGICISTGRVESAKSILRTFAFYEKDGLMPSIQRMTTSYQKDQQKYCKIAEFRNRLTGISMLISVFKNHENSSPSVVLLTGYSDDLSVNSIKRGIYLTNVYYQKKENKTIVYVKSSAYVYISTLCIGMNGSLKLSHENNLDLPSDAIEIPIS